MAPKRLTVETLSAKRLTVESLSAKRLGAKRLCSKRTLSDPPASLPMKRPRQPVERRRRYPFLTMAWAIARALQPEKLHLAELKKAALDHLPILTILFQSKGKLKFWTKTEIFLQYLGDLLDQDSPVAFLEFQHAHQGNGFTVFDLRLAIAWDRYFHRKDQAVPFDAFFDACFFETRLDEILEVLDPGTFSEFEPAFHPFSSYLESFPHVVDFYDVAEFAPETDLKGLSPELKAQLEQLSKPGQDGPLDHKPVSSVPSVPEFFDTIDCS